MSSSRQMRWHRYWRCLCDLWRTGRSPLWTGHSLRLVHNIPIGTGYKNLRTRWKWKRLTESFNNAHRSTKNGALAGNGETWWWKKFLIMMVQSTCVGYVSRSDLSLCHFRFNERLRWIGILQFFFHLFCTVVMLSKWFPSEVKHWLI